MIKYSIIIPVYNKAETISESIQSVLSQTEMNYEIIVVNDGSTDDIFRVLEKYEVVRVINQDNSGVSVARNTGIKAAKGEYICFLDADDWWMPNHLEELSLLIDSFPSAKMFLTSHVETMYNADSTNSSRHLMEFPERFLCDNLFKLLNENSYSIIHTNSVCVDKSFIIAENIYFEPGERIGEDTDFWYRVALNSSVAISRNDTTVYRRENSTATKNGSNSFDWIFSRRLADIEKGDYSKDRIKECRKLIERNWLVCSRNYILINDRAKAKEMLKNIRYHNKRYYFTRFLTLLPYSISQRLIKFFGRVRSC